VKTAGTLTGSLADTPEQARQLEHLGADIATTIELGHDPMMQLAMAATSTEKIKLMTSITVAFARSPMTLALTAHDINALSRGRFILGIGSQIKPHIEKRYSMPWSKPAYRKALQHALVQARGSYARVCAGIESDLGLLV
jgi:alkanesulfonate monooxygenase SsuD/methylene tetrahydromethanopterin reductase-like flavin-dependent oxidoreductase (luciferase family)